MTLHALSLLGGLLVCGLGFVLYRREKAQKAEHATWMLIAAREGEALGRAVGRTQVLYALRDVHMDYDAVTDTCRVPEQAFQMRLAHHIAHPEEAFDAALGEHRVCICGKCEPFA